MNTKEFFCQWECPDKEKKVVAQSIAILAADRLKERSEEPKVPHYRIPIGLHSIPDQWVQCLLIQYQEKNFDRSREFIAGQLSVRNGSKEIISLDRVKMWYSGDFYWVAQEDIPEGIEIPRDWILVN